MEYLFGYGAGLLTLINPCVLPILPIVLATALQAGRSGPILLAAGMSLSFVVLGLGVSAFGYALGLTPETIADIGAVLMIGFGLVLLLPRLSARFASATAGLSALADARMEELDRASLRGQFAAGLLLGAVWTPCVGPTLGGAISLASQGQALGHAAAIMAAFALGVSTVIMALAYGARAAIRRRQSWMRALATRARPVMGVVFIAVGAGLLFRLHHWLEYQALQILPAWLVDLSVSL
ncbi:Cytochrome c biogenesis protein CcdA [Meinhardsimonia xiamenensis]|jgi:cytochrome c biogenesis protein CcdA|uniref:Cytochrome c biogenesis protein CcdA n=1 Tax=Meinhardsimonia xiamenensis TaxID=990712 RepID=A0A1G9DTZ1_9RHOB|nr:cytochrome c biogenesis CcdA family protein [Meinhardsimonia xiamenensis]PRX31202.1 cytochrome c biogenesis protein CcdA [Meinhardsimonia xiamenensis]SDK67326.1 Cytochrome c biogenesis protein CcdA [Meinhardsimonia xiamenensis]